MPGSWLSFTVDGIFPAFQHVSNQTESRRPITDYRATTCSFRLRVGAMFRELGTEPAVNGGQQVSIFGFKSDFRASRDS